MTITRKRTPGRALRALTTTLVPALLVALLLAGAALAAGHEGLGKSARPGKPTAKAPTGTIATATPTFTWSKARGAARYELRVYEAGTLLLKKTGISKSKLSWTSSMPLPTNVDLTWKVRGSNSSGAGAWSGSLAFKVVPPSPERAITAFTVPGQTGATVINEADKTIALTVPFGTNVGALVATFTTTGASVMIAGTPQTSGVTANDFSNAVTYTVTAADASTQAYVVTVTVAALAIGDAYQGGKVAYILQSTDPGYSWSVQHGLIAATADQSTGIMWALPAYQATSVPGGTGTAIGSGAANTNAIIAQNAPGITYAAGLARAYIGWFYSDWYLPSKDELNKLYINRVAIGGFESAWYWSSSEGGALAAWAQGFDDGIQYGGYGKFVPFRVRAVRAF